MQGLSGFAFGLVAMGIWAWSLDPVLAGPLVVFGSLIGQLLATGSMWRSMNPWRALPFVLGGIVGVPLGVLLLRYINPTGFKASVGVLLVIWCPSMLFARDLPRINCGWKMGRRRGRLDRRHHGRAGRADRPSADPMGDAAWLGSPRATRRVPGVQYLHAQFDSGDLFRDRDNPARALPLFAMMLPAMVIPTLGGFRLYRRFSDQTFRRVVLGLLTASGAVLIVTSVAKLL